MCFEKLSINTILQLRTNKYSQNRKDFISFNINPLQRIILIKLKNYKEAIENEKGAEFLIILNQMH